MRSSDSRLASCSCVVPSGFVWPSEGSGLEGFAALAAARGRPERAARLHAASDALRERIVVPLPPAEREKVEGERAVLRAALGDEAFDSAWTAGRALTWEQATEHAREGGRDAGGVA